MIGYTPLVATWQTLLPTPRVVIVTPGACIFLYVIDMSVDTTSCPYGGGWGFVIPWYSHLDAFCIQQYLICANYHVPIVCITVCV